MSLSAVTSPYLPLVGLTGIGLNGGSLYVGVDGQDPQTNPQTCYWDLAGTIVAAQPISIVGGYPMHLGSPAQLFTQSGSYSIRLRDANGVQVFYVPSITGSLTPTGAAEDVDLLSFIPTAEWAAILAATSTFDCAPALRNAIASISTNVISGAIGGPKILLPYGTIHVNSTIELKRTVTIQGRSGGGMAGQTGTIVKFPADTMGFIVQRYNTTGSGVEVPATTGADDSVFRSFTLQGGGGTNASAHGIWLRARATIEDVIVTGFKGNGINIVATAGGGGALEGNANNWQVSRCSVISNGGHGLFTDGADCNAGAAVGVNASSNTGYGIYDSSFLGNSYVGCHSASNVAGAYQTDNANAGNVLVGCYSESGQPASKLVHPTLILGGLHAAGFTTDSTAAFLRSGQGISDVGLGTFNHGVGDSAVDGSGNTVASQIGGEATNGTVLAMKHTTSGPLAFRMRWHGGNLRWDYANLDSAVTHQITGIDTTLKFGRSVIQPGMLNLVGPFVGFGDNARQQTTGTAAPTTGEHGRGDVVWNISAAAGGKVGWVCTAAGTPGTWKAFGVIDP